MSVAEVERFQKDLSAKPGMRTELAAKATGLAALVSAAKALGYDFTIDEAKAFARANSPRALSDGDLDRIAGGDSVGTSVKVATVEVAAAVTTEATATVTTSAGVTEAVVAAVVVLI